MKTDFLQLHLDRVSKYLDKFTKRGTEILFNSFRSELYLEFMFETGQKIPIY